MEMEGRPGDQVFLKSDVVEGLLVKVIVKLRETAILLPYIRGPHVPLGPGDETARLLARTNLSVHPFLLQMRHKEVGKRTETR